MTFLVCFLCIIFMTVPSRAIIQVLTFSHIKEAAESFGLFKEKFIEACPGVVNDANITLGKLYANLESSSDLVSNYNGNECILYRLGNTRTNIWYLGETLNNIKPKESAYIFILLESKIADYLFGDSLKNGKSIRHKDYIEALQNRYPNLVLVEYLNNLCDHFNSLSKIIDNVVDKPEQTTVDQPIACVRELEIVEESVSSKIVIENFELRREIELLRNQQKSDTVIFLENLKSQILDQIFYGSLLICCLLGFILVTVIRDFSQFSY